MRSYAYRELISYPADSSNRCKQNIEPNNTIYLYAETKILNIRLYVLYHNPQMDWAQSIKEKSITHWQFDGSILQSSRRENEINISVMALNQK